MSLGRRDKVHFPERYKDFYLIRTHGRVYGIPNALDPACVMHNDRLFDHPAVLSAPTLTEMQELIDRFDPTTIEPETVGAYHGYTLLRLQGKLYAVPDNAPPGDLHLPEERARLGVLTAPNREQLEETIDRADTTTPVEFGGWLPVFQSSGNCGRHPQFRHTGQPPEGYRFTCSAPPPERRPTRWARLSGWLARKGKKILGGIGAAFRMCGAFIRPRRGVTIRARLSIFVSLLRTYGRMLLRGCKPLPALRFVASRNLQSQLLIGKQRGLVFLTSMPYTYNQSPWVLEIEDPTTLFYPFIQNGHTCGLQIADSPYFRIVKSLLEADSCRGILTHMQSTARLVPTLFGSETIARKVVYAPLGVKLPAQFQRHEPQAPEEPIHLLFINSWCQALENFYVRGGLDILEAFATLKIRYPQLQLTLRTGLPHLDNHYHRILESGWVRVINRFMTSEEMAELQASSHIFLLPAARVHIVSLLQAMSYGLAVVASDGWGFEEYLEHERNGLIVRGRYGKTSWADEQAGLLREDYEPMYTPDPQVVEGIIEAVSRLVEDVQLRRRLGQTARSDVATKFNLHNWNMGVKRAFDFASGRQNDPSGSGEETLHEELLCRA